MPPYGLYQMPRHHLYGQVRVPRRSFNSNDFANDDAPGVKTDEMSVRKEKKDKKERELLDSREVLIGKSDELEVEVSGERKKKKKDKKEKKSKDIVEVENQMAENTVDGSEAVNSATDDAAVEAHGTESEPKSVKKDGKSKRDKKEKKEKEKEERKKAKQSLDGQVASTIADEIEASAANTVTVDTTPAATSSKDKKEKRKAKQSLDEQGTLKVANEIEVSLAEADTIIIDTTPAATSSKDKQERRKTKQSLDDESISEAADEIEAFITSAFDTTPTATSVKEKKQKRRGRQALDKQGALEAADKIEASLNIAVDTTPTATMSKEKKEKTKAKQSLEGQGALKATDEVEASSIVAVDTTPAAISSKDKKSKDKKQKEKKDKAIDDAKPFAKKRKRESDVQAVATIAPHVRLDANPSLDPGWLHTSKTMSEVPSASFSPPAEAPTLKKRSKVVVKSRSAPTLVIAAQETAKNAASNENNVTALVEPVPEKRGRPPTPKLEAQSGPASAAKLAVPAPLSPRETPQMTPVLLPQHNSLSKTTKTPIPLPHKMQPHLSRSVTDTPRSQREPTSQTSRVLVVETPQSQMGETLDSFINTPVPFSLASNPSTAARPSTKRKATPSPLPSSIPLTSQDSPSKRCKLSTSLNASKSVSLTTTNLHRYTEPLRDDPKPRPRKRSASLARSTSSSASSMSIQAAFARVAKPCPETALLVSPATLKASKQAAMKEKSRETHGEPGVEAFETALQDVRKMVNFSEEDAYFVQFRSWREHEAARSALNCLGVLTGCNAKKEEVLRLANLAPQSYTAIKPATNAATLESARVATDHAISLLSLALRARLPVPLGPIAGTWHLFAPSYSTVHVDKYATRRTLSISPIAGFTSTTTYTARLSIPPRPLPFAIRAFDVPPHASFRTTALRTVQEGYGIEVVWLGGGYVLVRMDVQLLLHGRSAEKGERVMEFLGVREGAVVWEEEKGEGEEGGRNA